MLHSGDFSPKRKRKKREKKTAVQEWKLENTNNQASGEEDKNAEKKKRI